MSEEKPAIQQESVKLFKNSKGYNWEIKLLGHPNLTDETTEILEKLNNVFKKKFEGGT